MGYVNKKISTFRQIKFHTDESTIVLFKHQTQNKYEMKKLE